ncbi:hypothetical protein ACRALDRAFT_1062424 [Sodiomyces alcalophilus JCM 7366]|uniref:uncharacterized protein n=1 Tax=Sodiomyces alcalophilus JCM 7366 TaxID=591952 RepID=UPI0039B5530B
MVTDSKPRKKPVPVLLKPPPLYQGRGSYTAELRSSGDVEFVLPRSARSTSKTVDTIKVNSAALPQPFLCPDVIMKWAKDNSQSR